MLAQIRIELWNLIEERVTVVGETVVDFVAYLQLRQSEHRRLPQSQHLAIEGGVEFGGFTRRKRAAKSDRHLADRLDARESAFARLSAQHVAEDAAQQTRILLERQILVDGGVHEREYATRLACVAGRACECSDFTKRKRRYGQDWRMGGRRAGRPAKDPAGARSAHAHGSAVRAGAKG